MSGGKDLYSKAGVNMETGDAVVEWLGQNSVAQQKDFPGGKTLDGMGGFAGLFLPNLKGMEEPVLVASTDGVGTKLLLAMELEDLTGLGQDLVGMCVNDLYTCGAQPLFFLDYYATGVLQKTQFEQVLQGIIASCHTCKMALLGGETAELPGLYSKGHFDLAGFVVGMLDRKKQLSSTRVKTGDVLLGLASSGFHSNGFSLLRKWLDQHSELKSRYGKKILTPTLLYHQLPLLVQELGTEKIHAAAHITGGGISGNLPRVLPDGTKAVIPWKNVLTPSWMQEIFQTAGVKREEVEEVFNLGVGMILVVSASALQETAALCQKWGLSTFPLGSVESGKGEPHVEFV